MSDYYKNLTAQDLNAALPLKTLFSVWDTYYNAESKDLYFVGIKLDLTRQGAAAAPPLPKYTARGVKITSQQI
jgi:hypothetical protein